MSSPFARYLIQVILLAAAYLAAATIGLVAFALDPARVATAVWPASGIALAAVLLLGMRVWPGVWLGALLANGMNALVALAVSGSVGEPGAWLGELLEKMPNVSLATAAAIATGNTCEALLAAWLCRRWLPQEQPPFQRVEEVFLFAVVAGLASMVAATVGTASAALGGGATWPQFLAELGHLVAGRRGRTDDRGPVGAGLRETQAHGMERLPVGRIGDPVRPAWSWPVRPFSAAGSPSRSHTICCMSP